MRTHQKPKEKLTAEELKRFLKYDEISGNFIRVLKVRRCNVGEIAGHNGGRYIRISIHDIAYSAHRLAWLYMTGEFPDKYIDHKDANTHNNSWSNLREADPSSNRYNAKSSKNTTGFKGIWYNGERKKWESKIRIKGKCINLGRHINKEDAAKAYDDAAKKYHGEFYRNTINT